MNEPIHPADLSDAAKAAFDPRPAALPSTTRALAGLCLCMLLSSLCTSIANVALPTLARTFDAAFQSVQWIVLAYLLGVTCAIVSVGRIGDLTGRRRLLQAGLVLFIGASALSGSAPTLGWVVVARALQGLGAAVMMALSVALVSEIVPRAKTGSAMGLLGTTSAIGTALGPSLGGILIDQLGWRSIFLINVPLGAITLLLAQRYVPADRPATDSNPAAFDAIGTLLLALTLGAYALAMTLGRGHFGALNVALLVAAGLGVGLFVLVERRVPSPLIRWATFGEPGLSASLAANLLVTSVQMATLVVGPFYLSLALGLDTGHVGLVMSVGPLVAAVGGIPAGRIVDRFGAQRTALVGVGGMTVGAVLLSVIPERLGIPGYWGPIIIMTAHYALFQAANNTAVMRDVSPDRRGVISGLLSLSRNLGLITGTSVMGALFALASGTNDLLGAPAHAIAAGMRITFGVGAALVGVALLIVTRATSNGRAQG